MRIVFDPKLRRPGCVLLQSAMGGTLTNARLEMLFPVETWLLAPTPDMRAFPVTDEQLTVLAALAKETIDGNA